MSEAAVTTPVVEQDPWLDEFTHSLQQDTPEERAANLQAIADEEAFSTPAGLNPEVVRTSPEQTERPGQEYAEEFEEETPVAQPAQPTAAEPAEPNVTTFEDGSTFTVIRGKKGWEGILDTGIPGAKTENFYGVTQAEMYQKLAYAKVHATRKIREQNRIIKLGKPTVVAAPLAPVAQTKRALTNDELFDLRTKFEANPEEALAELVKKRTGVDIDTLVQKAQDGEAARIEMILGDVATAFTTKNPGYHGSPSNFWTMVAYISKQNLNQTLTDENRNELLSQLVRTNQWTVENLEDAFEDLTESGLLESKPATPSKPAEPAQPAPTAIPEPAAAVPVTPAPPISEREVRRIRQPRAGFGIRERESTQATPPAPVQPLPVTDYDSLSDTQISELLAGVRRDMRGKR